MPEVAPIKQPTGLPTRLIERSPNADDLGRWRRLKREFERASNLSDAAALYLENIYTTKAFADQNSVSMPIMDTELEELEQKFFELNDKLEEIKRAIRMAEDHKLGIRQSGPRDIDFIELPEYSISGLIIPIIAGVVVLAGAIAAAVYLQRENLELTIKYARLLTATDEMFCDDAGSSLCANWEQTKKEAKYDQNMTIAESLKKGIKTVAGGAATGLILAIGLIVFLRSRK